MNKSYRIVWNKVRNCRMVVSETTKSQGKGETRKTVAISRVAAAVIALGAAAAQASTDYLIPTSPGGYVYGSTLTLGSGDTLEVESTGSVGGISASEGVFASNVTLGVKSTGSDTFSILNAGNILAATAGISLSSVTFSGGMINSGSIAGSSHGIYAIQSSLSGGIANSGSINGVNAAIYINQSTLSGGITNGGSISGGYGINANQSSISGDITNSGSIVVDNAGITLRDSFLSGDIKNSGSIKEGTTAIRLDGSNVLGGIVNTGTISSNANNPSIALIRSSTLNGGIFNSGLIGASSGAGVLVSGQSVVSNGITNNGTITSYATGLTINNVSTLSGGLLNRGLISGGASGVRIKSGSSLAGGVLNNGTISGGNNGIWLSASAISGGVTNNGKISGGQYGINVDTSSQINGGITNSGLISGGTNSIYVSAGATLDHIVISGNNTASFSGAVYAPTTDVTVSNGSTYTLDTTFEVNNFINQGKLIVPSNVQTIRGDFTLASGGTFSPTIVSPTQYAQVVVSDAVQVAGELAINAASIRSFQTGSVLTGVLSGSALVGTFDTYSDTSYLYDFVPVYSATEVGLQIVRSQTIVNSVNAAGNTAGRGAAGALDTISSLSGTMSTVTATFGRMSSYAEISNAVSQTLPGLSAATPVQTLSVLSAINQSIESRSLKLRGMSSGETFYGNSSVWMKPFGSWMNQGNMNGAYGFKANSGGLMLGADHQPTGDTKLGAAFAWGNSSANSNMAGQSQTSNLYQFIGYGTHALTDSINLNGQANGGWNNNTSNRQIGFMGTSAQASYSSAVWHAGLGLDSPQALTESTSFIPQLRFDYTWIRNSGYNETGANYGLGLNVAAQTYQTSILSTDGKVVHKLNDHHSVNATLGVGYNFSPTQTWVAASFQGSPGLQFTTNGVNPSAVMGRAGVGYNYKIKEDVDVGIRYDIDVQNQYTNQIATAKARWMF